MTQEQRPIPDLAKSAFAMAQSDQQQKLNILAAQTLGAMGLSPSDGWVVDVGGAQAVREVPDIPQQPQE